MMMFEAKDGEHLTALEQIKDYTIVPYSGSISVDPATGSIWRWSEALNELPGIAKGWATSVIQYDLFMIGATQYLLPVTLVQETRYETNWFV